MLSCVDAMRKISSILLSNNYTNFEALMTFNYSHLFDSSGGKFVEVHENCSKWAVLWLMG
jgi:hypothetical protein